MLSDFIILEILKSIPRNKSAAKKITCKAEALRVGANIVINKIFDDCKLKSFLEKFFTEKDPGLLQDLMAYTIICENNAGQYDPDYAATQKTILRSFGIDDATIRRKAASFCEQLAALPIK